MKRLLPLLLLACFCLLGATPAPSPTVEGCTATICLDGCYFTGGFITGHRFAVWIPLENDPRFGSLWAINDGGQFMGWCILFVDGAESQNYHLATAAELVPLGLLQPGWYDANGKIEADLPPTVRKLLTAKGGKP